MPLRAAGLLVLDALILIVALAIVAILALGGAEFHIGGLHVSARSVTNPVLALLILAALRYASSARAFTFYPRLDRDSLRRGAARAVEALRVRLSSLDAARGRRYVLALALASLLLKLANIVWYQGFYSGDDVEIHEMTLGLILHKEWPVWNLRSPVFPVGFILPVQWLLVHAGVTDTTTLIAAARIVVALFSTLNIWLVWAVAWRQWQSLPIALLAAFLLATNGVHVMFGSSELPRTVATTFLLAAFWLLQTSTWDTPVSRLTAAGLSILAGLSIGLGGAIRFSEIMFLLPAMLLVARQRRWLQVAGVAFGAVVAYAGLVALGDWLYWGSPFSSARHIVQYTLVDRLSSRGYEPWHYYVSHAFQWTDPFAIAAVGIAVATRERRAIDVALWAGLPLLLLSMLPHKEPRYLLPILPFWAALAAFGTWQAIEHIRASARKERLAVGLLALAAVGLLFETDRYRFRRSGDAVDAAQYVASQHPVVVAVENAWTAGGNLYLPDAKIVDVELRDPENRQRAIDTLCADRAIDWAILRRNAPGDRNDLTERLRPCGLSPVTSPSVRDTCILFRR